MDERAGEPLALGFGHELLLALGADMAEGADRPPAHPESGQLCQLILVRQAGFPAAPPPEIRYPSSRTPFQMVAGAGWGDDGEAAALLLAPLVDTPPRMLEVEWPGGGATVPLPPEWRQRLTATEPAPA